MRACVCGVTFIHSFFVIMLAGFFPVFTSTAITSNAPLTQVSTITDDCEHNNQQAMLAWCDKQQPRPLALLNTFVTYRTSLACYFKSLG